MVRKFRQQAGPKAIGRFLGASTRATLVKRGFAHADILSNWETIVGPTLANVSSPERLNFTRHKNNDASLKVRVMPGHAPEFQHFEPLIIERINSFFGFRAVGRIQIIQAPVKRPEKKRKIEPPPPTEEQKQWLEEVLTGVPDPELRERLQALGTSLLRTQNQKEAEKNTRQPPPKQP
ncbi:DUF721 domain-containing protein [Sneathiella chinensis]|uniref:DUF721 domain-containing protein n=1 Tax=Sneathiella chinensis TaxID=349750 RepID=A0ABQ5U1S7_9PROT|nr:DciA family protein [Sneathiella chinensis]GLQ05698.1 hypothetical protein GCM10007924_09190 [Sneathiella chinensis]